jgi:hypothetical protein
MRCCTLFLFTLLFSITCLQAQREHSFYFSSGVFYFFSEWSTDADPDGYPFDFSPNLQDDLGGQLAITWQPPGRFGAMVVGGYQPARVSGGSLYNRQTEVRQTVEYNPGTDWWITAGPSFSPDIESSGKQLSLHLLVGYRQVRLENAMETYIDLTDFDRKTHLYSFSDQGGWILLTGGKISAPLGNGPLGLFLSGNLVFSQTKQDVTDLLNLDGLFLPGLKFRQRALMGSLGLSVKL